jgi:hypothetical protein
VNQLTSGEAAGPYVRAPEQDRERRIDAAYSTLLRSTRQQLHSPGAGVGGEELRGATLTLAF